MDREIKYCQAINEALGICMQNDPNVYLIGLGVPDPKGIFGSTLGLLKKFGSQRVMDMPTSENGITGIAIGSALTGMRPIMTHQRIDFAILAMEQIVNQAAKWYYMFGGQASVPLVIRMIIGRGWGQGPHHSQSLQAWFAHIPGLKVVMPTTPYDVKGLMISSVEDNNPVIFIEHRWLYNISGIVPEGYYRTPIGVSRITREGKDLTIVATSYMTIEAMRAADLLRKEGIYVEVIDVRTLRPLDDTMIFESVQKTGRLIVADTGWQSFGVSAEIVARVAEKALHDLKYPPQRVALPETPSPTTFVLANQYFPTSRNILMTAKQMDLKIPDHLLNAETPPLLDIPDSSFSGPF